MWEMESHSVGNGSDRVAVRPGRQGYVRSVNLDGVMFGCRFAIPAMVERGGEAAFVTGQTFTVDGGYTAHH